MTTSALQHDADFRPAHAATSANDEGVGCAVLIHATDADALPSSSCGIQARRPREDGLADAVWFRPTTAIVPRRPRKLPVCAAPRARSPTGCSRLKH